MRRVYTASLYIDGTKTQKEFSNEETASLWLRMMTAQYFGRVASPSLTCTLYSDIFNAPMIGEPTKEVQWK